MLDREILKTNYGVSYGSVTLKSLQNDNIPELDLLVREAIYTIPKENQTSKNINKLQTPFIAGRASPVKTINE